MNDLAKRTLSGALYAFVILLCDTHLGANLFYKLTGIETNPDYWLWGLTTIFLALCLYEAIKMFQFQSYLYIILTVLLCSGIYYFFSDKYLHGIYAIYNYSQYLIPVLFTIALVTIFKFTDEIEFDSSKLIVIAVYIALPFGVSLFVSKQSHFFTGKTLVNSVIFTIFLLIWLSDVGAYLVGKYFGKRPFMAHISPKKTLEGFIGGFISVIIGGLLLNVNIYCILIVAIFAPIGDLTESKLKRYFEVKDSGTLIPGHGGFLDRLDSFIVVIPYIYTYYIIQSLV